MAVDDDCKRKLLELKAKRTYRFVVFKVEEKQKQVVVDKLGEPNLTYDDFAATLLATSAGTASTTSTSSPRRGARRARSSSSHGKSSVLHIQVAALAPHSFPIHHSESSSAN
jgi:hypothetical protein